MARWLKLRSGDWGVSGDANEIVPGETVTVTKKDGGTSTVVIDRVIWTDGTTSIATIQRFRSRHTCDDTCYATHPCRMCGQNDAYAVNGEWGCFYYDEYV